MIKLEKSISLHLERVQLNLDKTAELLELYIESRSAPYEKKAVTKAIPKHT